MNPKFPHPIAAEWRAIDFSTILGASPEPVIETHHSTLIAAVNSADAEGDQTRVRPLALAMLVSSMIFRTEGAKTSLVPLAEYTDGRTTMRVDDFDDAQLGVLAEVVEEIEDPELRARVADVLWSHRRRDQLATAASAAYLECVRRLENDLFHFRHRLTRAMEIAASLRKDAAPLDAAVAYAEELLTRLAADDPLALMDDVVALLLAHKRGDVPTMLAALRARGATLATEGRTLEAARYAQVEQDCAKRSGDSEAFRAAVAAEAEAYASYGAGMDDGNPEHAMGAAHHFGMAIQTYRKAGKDAGYDTRIEEIHRLMLKCQQIAVESFQEITVKHEVPQAVNDLVNAARGLELGDVMKYLVRGSSIQSKAAIREQAKGVIEGNGPLFNLFSSVQVREDGLVDAQTAGISPGEDPTEERISQESYAQASLQRQLVAISFIEPVREIIMEEHGSEIEQIQGIVVGNGFVPQGREAIYVKGLLHGFYGDYVAAAHLLIPQIENSVRYLLHKAGVIASGFDKDGIQNSYDLNKTLYMPKFVELVGENMAFDLTGLLIHRHGANLRNNLMHGLVNEESMQSKELTYVWSLVLRLLAMHAPRPNVSAADPRMQQSENPSGGSGDV